MGSGVWLLRLTGRVSRLRWWLNWRGSGTRNIGRSIALTGYGIYEAKSMIL